MRVLHCLRSPIGGLFRHVHDLVKGEAELGLEVGVVCDSLTGGEEGAKALNRLTEACVLGVTRLPMSRQLGWRDWRGYTEVARIAARLGIDILHGHGAKGGAYARLAGRALKRKRHDIRAFYTPHGGSLHYSRTSPLGRLYLAAERRLASLTDGLIFESVFAARRYAELIGEPSCPVRVVPNGLYPYEFYTPILADDAADFVFVGELRQLKGVDVLLSALASLQSANPARAIIVGGGPDADIFKRQARQLGLGRKALFPGPQPARSAFARGRCVVVPSRAESFPYIVLEAAAARMPLIATEVGGIPEMVAGIEMPLVPPGDSHALAEQMRAFLIDPRPFLERAAGLQEQVAERFTVANMTMDVVDFYFAAKDLTASSFSSAPASVF